MKGTESTFLVVEDNDLDVEKIERAFKRLQIVNPIVRARDGLHALDYLRGDGGRERLKRPIIVLLDLNMPRMNGHEFLQNLRADEQLSDTPVFVLTTSDHQQDIRTAHQHNICGYIVKPINQAQMLEALSTLNLFWKLCEFAQNGQN